MFKFNNQRKLTKHFHSREYFNNLGREEPTEQAVFNATQLLLKCEKVREEFGKPLVITSGCRTYHHNLIIYHHLNELREEEGLDPLPTAFNSDHLIEKCMAVDFADPNKELANFILKDPLILSRHNLFMEDPKYTKTWVHLSVNPKSKRIFRPY